MTTIRVGVTANTARIEGVASQIPFALSKTINAVLVKAQAKQLERMRQTFTIRREPFLKRAVKITQFAKKTTLVGEIAIASPNDRADIFAKFEVGGTKRPTKGANLAIPVLGSPVKKTAKAVIQAKNRPRALLNESQEGVKRAKSFAGAFIRPAKGGKPAMLFVRQGRTLKLAYVLEPQAPIKPELHFVDTVSKEITATWASEFDAQLANALQTAKR